MIAEDLMTLDPVSISPDALVLEAAEIMLRHHVSGLPVVGSDGTLIGMITAGDLMRRAELATELHRGGFAEFKAGRERLAADYVRAHGKHVKQVMTPSPFAVARDAPIQDIVNIMDRHDVKRVPVTDGQKLVGLVSRTDLLRALVKAAQNAPCGPCDDNEIKRRLLAIFTRESWAPLATLDVSVRAGIVDLVGAIQSEAQRAALIAAAESIPGVRSVSDHLVLSQTQTAQAPF